MNAKRNLRFLVVAFSFLIAIACSSSKKQADLAAGCCQECIEAFSQSPVGVGAAGAQCGEFTTAKPMSDKCRDYFAANPRTVADCQ